jgi:hypothetical protein
VEAGWDRIFTFERNGKLTVTGYLVNALLALTCLFALIYPALEIIYLFNFDCPFRSITGLPCPGCGFTRSMESMLGGKFLMSFMHNPGWIILVFFLGTMIGIGVRSIISGKQLVLNKRWLIMFIVTLGSTWIGKFMLGSAYY